MKITFRWYGESDRITLNQIRQIPCVSGVVSAIYDTPVGSVWSEESIARLVGQCNAAGLECEVIESVPVHEDIKLGLPSAKRYIDAYCENIRRLAKHGVKCICYNFMPVFDWLRSDLETPLPDGSNALTYRHRTVLEMDPATSELSLPGWDESYTKEGLKALLKQYESVDEEKLWGNLQHFLEAVIPVAEAEGVKMGIHPDDPPYPILGLPRIAGNMEDFKYILNAVDMPFNGVCFCTGSLSAGKDNDIPALLEEVKERVYFAHLRAVKKDDMGNFYEADHLDGDVDMYRVVEILSKENQNRAESIVFRPDHGHQLLDDLHKVSNPGYSAIGRLKGLAEIRGLELGVIRNANPS